MKKLLLILLIASSCYAGGPSYGPDYTKQNTNQEFQQVYHDLQYPVISTGTAQNFTIVNSSISKLIVTGTITIPPGIQRVLNRVQSTNTAQTTTTSAAFVDSNLSVSITPSLVTSSVTIRATFYSEVTDGGSCFYTFGDGTTDFGGSSGIMRITNGAGGESEIDVPVAMEWTTWPNTTSAKTYKVRFLASGNTCRIGAANVQNTITVEEIKS